jgi:hypothetical protein
LRVELDRANANVARARSDAITAHRELRAEHEEASRARGEAKSSALARQHLDAELTSLRAALAASASAGGSAPTIVNSAQLTAQLASTIPCLFLGPPWSRVRVPGSTSALYRSARR